MSKFSTRLTIFGASIAVIAGLMASMAGAAAAAVNDITPSTNDINKASGMAYVDVTPGPGTASLAFTTPNTWYSCFEYRTDGDSSQILSGENGGTNYNELVTDGLYPYVCGNGANPADPVTVNADEYVEVRMVFGAEADERFDWTRFDVLPAAPACLPTGFYRDGINLTAAQIGGNVTDTLDAAGCNVGVYYAPGTTGSVSAADISGANYYGVVVNAAAVNVTNSSIHHIGEVPFNGAQHGVGVFYTTLNPNTTSTGTAATGTVSGNVVNEYQKGGIVVNGPGASVTISGNTVTGEGPVPYIAQNGIQLGRGATGTITGNTVTGNAYTGSNNASSTGILVFGGGIYGDALTTGVSITGNTVTNNDMGVYVVNTDATGSKPPTTKTKNAIVNNTISNSQKTNVSGNGSPNGYQAGIVGYGKGDNIVNNKISGIGYDSTQAPLGSVYVMLDVDGANAHVHKNS